MSRPAVCYLVPQFDAQDSSHMAHVPALLEALADECDVHVVIQRARAAPALRGVRTVHIQPLGSHVRRAIDLVRVARRLRTKGCRVFFVRISTSAALILGIVAPLLDIRVYLWQSGQSRNIVQPFSRSPLARLRFEFDCLLQRVAMMLAHRFVTGPERMVAYYARQFGVKPARTVVLYNDIALEKMSKPSRAEARGFVRHQLNLANDAHVILFVGRVSPLKGGAQLIPLAERLRNIAPAATIAVVGDCQHTPGIEQEAAQRGLTQLHFVGSVPNGELAPWFRGADVLILPSESEGFPRVVLEAMAHGLPVVAFDVGGVRDILPPELAANVIPPRDVDEMAIRVSELLSAPDDLQRAAALGRESVKRFDTPVVARMFIDRIVLDRFK